MQHVIIDHGSQNNLLYASQEEAKHLKTWVLASVGNQIGGTKRRVCGCVTTPFYLCPGRVNFCDQKEERVIQIMMHELIYQDLSR